MEKQKIIFFLGNGFSQGFDFPSMNELWHKALKAYQEFYKDILEEAKQRYPFSYFISNNISDIELLLTAWQSYYESHEFYVDKSNHHVSGRGAFYDYISNICGWLCSYTIESKKLDIFNQFSEWLKDMNAKYEVMFITTNYDLLLEYAILKESLKYHFLESNEEDSMPIRKLHGSIAWFRYSNNICGNNNFKSPPFFENKTKNTYVHDFSKDILSSSNPVHFLAGNQEQLESQVDNKTKISTLIPPVIGKEYNELFAIIKQFTKQDFRGFDYFVIIGYSFPDADPVIKDIIINSYSEFKSDNSKIICINDNPDICSKIYKLFENKVECINEKWSLNRLKNLFLL